MDIFISWSGEKSRDVALTLSDWLRVVMQGLQPFVSSKDIYAGTRWQSEIAARLEATNFGIVCVTKKNQKNPWLNFEAGALAKAVDASRVVPLAIDLKPSDIELPLGQFQGQAATLSGLEAITQSLNAASPSSLSESVLKRSVAKWWPELEADLANIEVEHANDAASSLGGQRSERELLEETLNTVRALARESLTSAATVSDTAGPATDVPRHSRLSAQLLEAGDEIVHGKWGRGRVLVVDAGPGQALFEFPGVGEKLLDLGIAPLMLPPAN